MRFLKSWVFLFTTLFGLLIALLLYNIVYLAGSNLPDSDLVVEQPLPIGYTLWDVDNQRVIDVQPCPHSWAVAPTWYSWDQYVPALDRTFGFGYGVIVDGHAWQQLQPEGYEAPSSCGKAYE